MSGSEGERVAVVWAMIFSLPERWCGITGVFPSEPIFTWPPTRSTIAWPPPL
jgi:hypothetical protein